MGQEALSRAWEKPEIGKVFAGKYLIVEKLGEGGFGIVYAGHNGPTTRGFPVAIKWLKPERATNERAVRNFVDEADIAGHISSSHVVTVHDKSYDPPFIVMARLRGQSLRELIDRRTAEGNPRFSPAEAAELIIPVLRGIRAAHGTHSPSGGCVLHRDIKPDNIFLAETADGISPTLLDFGIAKLAEPEPGVTVETHEVVRGTPDYMAREQLFETANVGPWTDLHAVGVILYEMLSGARPYRAGRSESTLDVCFRVREGDFMPLDQRVPELPPTLVEVVHRAMKANYRERFEDASSFEVALKRALQAPTSAPPPPPLPPPDKPERREENTQRPDRTGTQNVSPPPPPEPDAPARAGLLKWVGAAAVVLVCGGAALWLGSSKKRNEVPELPKPTMTPAAGIVEALAEPEDLPKLPPLPDPEPEPALVATPPPAPVPGPTPAPTPTPARPRPPPTVGADKIQRTESDAGPAPVAHGDSTRRKRAQAVLLEANSLLERGYVDLAIDAYCKVRGLDPDNAEAKKHLNNLAQTCK